MKTLAAIMVMAALIFFVWLVAFFVLLRFDTYALLFRLLAYQ